MSPFAETFGPIVTHCTGLFRKAFLGKASLDRGFWSGKYDFLLSSIGYAVGMGNIWGFPFMCHANGGSAFLIPCIVLLVSVGLPLVFMEMAFGQYTNMGPVHGWKACPIMTGVGWGMCFIAGTASLAYNIVIAWSFYYTFASLRRSKLPWSGCGNPWNDEFCLESWRDLNHRSNVSINSLGQPCLATITKNCTAFETASEQYFNRVALGFVSYSGEQRKMTDPFGEPQWYLVLCLLLSWIIVLICLLRGIKTSGKVVYITALLPLVLLMMLMVRALALPGSVRGLRALISPDFTMLWKTSVWIDAAAQVLFTLGIGYGGLSTLASYNKLHHDCYRDALIVCFVDIITSILCSVTVFSLLGYVSQRTGQPVSSVIRSGRGFAFVVFAEAATSMPGGQAWSFLFFFMLVTFGIDTQFFTMEVLMTAVLDQWPSLREDVRKEISLKAVCCTVLFLLGLPMCCKGGIFLFEVFASYAEGFNLHMVVLGEIAGICCFYGLSNFLNDIKTMLGFKPGYFWIACWSFITPGIILTLTIIGLVTFRRPTVIDGRQEMADWGEALGWGLVLMTILIVVAFAVMWRPSISARRMSDQLENRLLRMLHRRKPGSESVKSPRTTNSATVSDGKGL